MGVQDPVGLPLVDRLDGLKTHTLDDYVKAASEYVRECRSLAAGPQKAAQLRLSAGLGKSLLSSLQASLPDLEHGVVGERTVAGALRAVKADVSEFHPLDGLRLAVELKPINLAVGRAIWNRFGDIRSFAVNVHLKFPFSVLGGVLTIPTYEMSNTGSKKSTKHLIERAVNRLIRAGGRRSEGDAPHLLEGVGVVVYDPETAALDPDLPPRKSGLRWDEFIKQLAFAYDSRFGEGASAAQAQLEDEENEE